MKKVKMICSNCGSTNVSKDAFADWDVKNQVWVLRDHYDEGYCHDCENSGKSAIEELDLLEEFRKSKRFVSDVENEGTGEVASGYIYLANENEEVKFIDHNLHIEVYGSEFYLLLENCEYTGELADLEEKLFEWTFNDGRFDD